MATITVGQAIQYARNAGFSGNGLVTIVAIAWAESGLNTTAINYDSNGTQDWGILQINSIHKISQSQANNPTFAFQYAYSSLSNGGTNFTAWTTYNSGTYKQYVPQVQAQINLGSGSSTSASKVASGDGNNFPPGQCTWWADERYHQLTGYYVPWNHTGQANAYQWLAQAKAFGWNTSNQPPKGIPSIICLQGNAGQGVESTLGHVAIVEKVNGDGSVLTSDMNWSVGQPFSTSINTLGYPVRQVTFKPGAGVSFIWAAAGAGNALDNGGGGSGGSGTYTPLLEQVHETLTNVPGFYGIALALDEAEQFPGWVDLTSGQWDVVGYIRSTGASISDNFVPFMIRSTLFGIGLFIMILLILKVVLEVGDQAIPIVKAAM